MDDMPLNLTAYERAVIDAITQGFDALCQLLGVLFVIYIVIRLAMYFGDRYYFWKQDTHGELTD